MLNDIFIWYDFGKVEERLNFNERNILTLVSRHSVKTFLLYIFFRLLKFPTIHKTFIIKHVNREKYIMRDIYKKKCFSLVFTYFHI